jgi:hypothetical protein
MLSPFHLIVFLIAQLLRLLPTRKASESGRRRRAGGARPLRSCAEQFSLKFRRTFHRRTAAELDDRRTIFEHELQLRSVITVGSDLLAAKPMPNRAMLRGMSTRRRSYSSAIQLAEVRH